MGLTQTVAFVAGAGQHGETTPPGGRLRHIGIAAVEAQLDPRQKSG
jgi:hypothetical protein